MKSNKILYFASLVIFSAIFFTGCEKEEGDVTPPGTIENIVVTPDFGGFIVSWQNPTDADFYYVDLTFTDAKGEQWSKKISSYANTAKIAGLTEEKEYQLDFVCFDKSGNASNKQTVKSICKTPPFALVAKTLVVKPDFGGINVKWNNISGKSVSVQVAYKDNSGAKQTQTAVSSQSSDILFLSGLQSKSQVFSIIVADSLGNKGEASQFELTPLAESKISKANWSVVSFSSEEAYGEGESNGRVIHAIDDNINSFWHSQWAEASPVYPHWFVIDMNATVTISRFECYRRQGSSSGPDKIKFYGSMDGNTWTDFGEFAFNRTINAAQNYRIPSNPEVRFFKFEATAGPNTYAHMGEINVYGSSK